MKYISLSSVSHTIMIFPRIKTQEKGDCKDEEGYKVPRKGKNGEE